VRALGPSGERPPGGVLEAQSHDALGEDVALADLEIGLELLYFEFGRAYHISEFLSSDEPMTVAGRDTFIARKGETRQVYLPRGRGESPQRVTRSEAPVITLLA
jgi:hypothetical protein